MINANYAANIIDGSGIGNYDHTQLMRFLKVKTFGVVPYINDLEEGFTGSSSPQDFEYLLQYIYMFFEAPRKDKSEELPGKKETGGSNSADSSDNENHDSDTSAAEETGTQKSPSSPSERTDTDK